MATTQPDLAFDLDDVRASLAVDSLSHFTRASWPLVEPGQPLVWGWHLDVICEHLEAVSRGWIRYLVMNVPPRYMKSLLTSGVSGFWSTHPRKSRQLSSSLNPPNSGGCPNSARSK